MSRRTRRSASRESPGGPAAAPTMPTPPARLDPGWLRRRSPSGQLPHPVERVPHLDEAGGQRRQSEPDAGRRAEVDEHAGLDQPRADLPGVRPADADVCSAPLGIPRRGEPRSPAAPATRRSSATTISVSCTALRRIARDAGLRDHRRALPHREDARASAACPDSMARMPVRRRRSPAPSRRSPGGRASPRWAGRAGRGGGHWRSSSAGAPGPAPTNLYVQPTAKSTSQASSCDLGRADGVAQVPDDERAGMVRDAGDRRHVGEIARAVGDVARGDDARCARRPRSRTIDPGVTPVARRLQPDQLEIEVAGQRLDHVPVGREVVPVEDDPAPAGPQVQRGAHGLVEVHRRGIGDDRLARRRAERGGRAVRRRPVPAAPSSPRTSRGSAGRPTAR